jgi:hypothetical protein
MGENYKNIEKMWQHVKKCANIEENAAMVIF